MSIRVVARDHIRPECKEKAFELLKELIAITRTEPGNISYQYFQDCNDPEYYAMIELWENQEALKAHLESDHFKRIIPQLGEMMAGPTRLEVYQEVI